MGNNESVSAGNKAQADSTACEWYRYIQISGEGELGKASIEFVRLMIGQFKKIFTHFIFILSVEA